MRGVSTLTGAGALSALWTREARAAREGMKLAMHLNPHQAADRAPMITQIGVSHAIAGVSGELDKVSRADYVRVLRGIKADFEARGLTIAGVEGHPVSAEKIKLGVAGRDEEIENYRAVIPALKQVGIPMICWNFMAGIGWYRTRADVPERGGALTTQFDLKAAEAQGLTEYGEIAEETMWANMEYFQKAVIPIAHEHGIQMALHPDDPPRSPLRGIARICISAANFRRILNIVPSPMNGVTFCQANFVAMGEDIQALATEWLQEKKIFFVHFRDIKGERDFFQETFHDNGPTDMAKMLKTYHDGGFTGPIRPDHAPTLDGEENDQPGYAMGGKVLAIGYMKGAMQGMGIPHE